MCSLVRGRGSDIGNALVEHSSIHAISSTGSVGEGRNIGVRCGISQKMMQPEVGGKDSQVVPEHADPAQAVELSVHTAFYSIGQRCSDLAN